MKMTMAVQGQLWRNLALLACFFVLLFSIDAKISVYRSPASASREVSASKMQESTSTDLQAGLATLATPANGGALLTLLCLFAGIFSLRLYSFQVPAPTESSSFLESTYGYLRLLRPPPAR
ncbi:MAG: hypothetical protein ABI383_10715 [Acidobacteriaceae bacterium]